MAGPSTSRPARAYLNISPPSMMARPPYSSVRMITEASTSPAELADTPALVFICPNTSQG